MASMSKAMLDKYIDIAVRPLRNAETARKDRIREDKDGCVKTFTMKRGITELYADAIRLRNRLDKLQIEMDAVSASIRKELGIPSWRSMNIRDAIDETNGHALEDAINSDPGLKRIHSEIQRIKDAIYLAPAPDKIAELIKSIDLSFLDEIVHDG